MPKFETVFRLTFPWIEDAQSFLQLMEERPLDDWKFSYTTHRATYLREAGFRSLPYIPSELRFIAEMTLIVSACHADHTFVDCWDLWRKETQKPNWGNKDGHHTDPTDLPKAPVNVCGCNQPNCSDVQKVYVPTIGFFNQCAVDAVEKANADWVARMSESADANTIYISSIN
jgi:hypothetical protein